jgi:hypothetical protein
MYLNSLEMPRPRSYWWSWRPSGGRTPLGNSLRHSDGGARLTSKLEERITERVEEGQELATAQQAKGEAEGLYPSDDG